MIKKWSNTADKTITEQEDENEDATDDGNDDEDDDEDANNDDYVDADDDDDEDDDANDGVRLDWTKYCTGETIQKIGNIFETSFSLNQSTCVIIDTYW